ncbi:MAG: pyruvate formate lyase 1-activating protein, partial [Treponema sp.]|nr:pyruvate formate lyase 1-activating protein [Treponema sp.]
INEEEHKKLTGQSGLNVKDMFHYLDEIKKPIWIRHVLTPGITDNDEYLAQTRDFVRTLHNVKRLEVLPYHGLGAIKYKEMGLDYVLKDVESPSLERVANAKKILECDKYTGWLD